MHFEPPVQRPRARVRPGAERVRRMRRRHRLPRRHAVLRHRRALRRAGVYAGSRAVRRRRSSRGLQRPRHRLGRHLMRVDADLRDGHVHRARVRARVRALRHRKRYGPAGVQRRRPRLRHRRVRGRPELQQRHLHAAGLHPWRIELRGDHRHAPLQRRRPRLRGDDAVSGHERVRHRDRHVRRLGVHTGRCHVQRQQSSSLQRGRPRQHHHCLRVGAVVQRRSLHAAGLHARRVRLRRREHATRLQRRRTRLHRGGVFGDECLPWRWNLYPMDVHAGRRDGMRFDGCSERLQRRWAGRGEHSMRHDGELQRRGLPHSGVHGRYRALRGGEHEHRRDLRRRRACVDADDLRCGPVVQRGHVPGLDMHTRHPELRDDLRHAPLQRRRPHLRTHDDLRHGVELQHWNGPLRRMDLHAGVGNLRRQHSACLQWRRSRLDRHRVLRDADLHRRRLRGLGMHAGRVLVSRREYPSRLQRRRPRLRRGRVSVDELLPRRRHVHSVDVRSWQHRRGVRVDDVATGLQWRRAGLQHRRVCSRPVVRGWNVRGALRRWHRRGRRGLR